MKKVLAAVMSLAMLLMLAVGCGSNNAIDKGSTSNSNVSANAGETKNPEDAKGTVEFMYWGSEQKDAMETIANEFMNEYPNIKVNLTQVPNDQYWTKLLTSIASGLHVQWFAGLIPLMRYL